MPEKEREILKKLSEIVPKPPDTKKERLLGVANGRKRIRVHRREVSE